MYFNIFKIKNKTENYYIQISHYMELILLRKIHIMI